jgi:hypothetical protein
VLYPLNLLFLGIEPNAGTHVILIINMVIGATGMLLLGRQLGLGGGGAGRRVGPGARRSMAQLTG